MSITAPSHLELAALDPDAFAGRVAAHLGKLATDVTSSELVYSPMGPVSYFRDMLFGGQPAEQRLTRHREQMALVRREREQRAAQRLSAAGIEYRVEPDRTPGYGGYFAPPAWLNQFFATANRPGRVLSGLIPTFPLPAGCSSINVPIMTKGTLDAPAADDVPVASQAFTDATTSSACVPFAGKSQVSLQLLEQSPPGAYLDWAIFLDMSEDYDYQLEQQLLTGSGVAPSNLLGVVNVGGTSTVTNYTGATTGQAVYPTLGKLAAQVSDARTKPPLCWLMRGARWFWLMSQEDTANLPFGAFSPFFLGSDDQTPDPIGFVMGLPVFVDGAISATQGAGANQDQILALRPTDMLLLEGEASTMINRERLSASLGVGVEMHSYVAALTGRRPAGIGVLGGVGLIVQSGY
jgi:hypothetical protein